MKYYIINGGVTPHAFAEQQKINPKLRESLTEISKSEHDRIVSLHTPVIDENGDIIEGADDSVRVLAIKEKARELILSAYPVYKQMNIIRSGGADLEVMSLFIDNIRAISNIAEVDGTALSDIAWSM